MAKRVSNSTEKNTLTFDLEKKYQQFKIVKNIQMEAVK